MAAVAAAERLTTLSKCTAHKPSPTPDTGAVAALQQIGRIAIKHLAQQIAGNCKSLAPTKLAQATPTSDILCKCTHVEPMTPTTQQHLLHWYTTTTTQAKRTWQPPGASSNPHSYHWNSQKAQRTDCHSSDSARSTATDEAGSDGAATAVATAGVADAAVNDSATAAEAAMTLTG
jgi:hypothetical protein